MRSLKFRAWDIEAKRYIKDPILVDNFGNAYVVCEESSNKKGTCLITGKPNVILEQYTGLKDRNGKEIYDGDIIQETLGFDVDSIDGTFKYKVFWNEDMLCWSLEYIGNESIHDDLYECNSTVEVIGNIYETPEQIGKEK